MSEESHLTGDTTMQAAAAPDATQMTHNAEQERQVPLSALESERAKRQQMEEENRMMKEHFALMQAQQVSKPAEKKSPTLDRNDVPTWGEVEDYLSEREKQYKSSYEELRMAQKYPDYQTVITKYLPEVIKQNPRLRESLSQTQDYELAYYLAKNSDAYKSQNVREQKNADAERIIKNSQQAGSLSSMGGSTPVAQSKRYKDMSDSEFRNLMHRNLGY